MACCSSTDGETPAAADLGLPGGMFRRRHAGADDCSAAVGRRRPAKGGSATRHHGQADGCAEDTWPHRDRGGPGSGSIAPRHGGVTPGGEAQRAVGQALVVVGLLPAQPVRWNARMGAFDRYGYIAARVMLAAIFLLTGYDKLVDVEDAVGDIAEVGLPLPALLAVTAGLVELVCGAFLALGRRTEWAAAGLLLFLVPVTVLIKKPLRADAHFGTVIDFLKNLAIVGGLLLVVLRERHAGQ